MIDLLLRSLLFFSILMGAVLFARDQRTAWIDRLVRALIAPALATTLCIFAKFILITPFWDRNASRLIGAFCLKLGLPLYPDPTTGVPQSMNYPPLAAILYWPATLAHTPTSALLLGAALNIFYFYAPVALLFFIYKRHAPDSLSKSWRAALILSFVMCSLLASGLNYSAFHLHADAPALGLAALAGLCCMDGAFALSAFFAVCAVWTKQSLIALLILLPLYVEFTVSRRGGARMAGQIAIFAGLFLALTLLRVSAHTLVFNLIYIVKKPWAGALGDLVPMQWSELILQQSVLPMMILTLLIPWPWTHVAPRPTLRTWLRGNPWALWILIAIAMLPAALANRCTIGGDVNAFSLVTYFLTLGALLLVRQQIADGPPALARLGRRIAAFLLLCLCATQTPQLLRFGLQEIVDALPGNPQETAFQYARQHPGEAYFPWNPLSTLMAEGTLYPFEPAVTDWAMARHPVTRAQYLAHIPPHLRLIAFHGRNEFTHEATWHFLPDYSEAASLPELPDWRIYRKRA